MFAWFETRIDPFKPTSGVHPLTPPTTKWRILRFFLGETGWPLAVMAGLTLLLSLIEVALPISIGWLIDAVTEADRSGDRVIDGRVILVFLLLLLAARPLIALLAQLVRNQVLSRNIGTLVRWRTHEFVARADISFFQNDFVGRIATKVTQTGQAIRSLLRLFADQLLFVVLYMVGVVGYLLVKHPLFAAPLIVWTVAYAILVSTYVPKSRAAAREVADTASIFSGRLVDGYSNYMTVRLFTASTREDAYVREALENGVTATGKQMRLMTGLSAMLTLVNGLLLAASGLVGVRLWSHGLATPGDIASVIAMTMQIQQLSRFATMSLSDLFESVGTLDDTVRSLSRPQLITDRPDAKPLAVTGGGIEIDRVSFGYGTGKDARLAIDDLTLDIAPGERIGLVGRSGAGKSTLVSLLLRLYDLETGAIRIDGQNIAKVTQNSLRAAVGVVTQDTSLLHRSIRDNIKYGRPDASDEEMLAAARMAHADEFIPDLVDNKGRTGFDAYVGERGVKLSGGQRQRIAIARVLLKNAPILVLDEATSALDSDVEAAIQESLGVLMEGKTVIAIAHRLSTIARMDRLVVMDRGRIIEMGSHADLVAKGGLYAGLWSRQTGGFLNIDEDEPA
ncbi:multidrug ABC transporter ATP-binding protein [Pleomorphomonas diazotrophica]|uniref:Multidrug ABC transporter ATP-binding protein n=1 Tax=Pleomorphomonas diazotrophica TaxID=1166257 RepID=A0A2N3M2J0_9HYPH|nr:multidrug ABC transporter ATP-binding protein [Pleomorphomonas diazotrophica]